MHIYITYIYNVWDLMHLYITYITYGDFMHIYITYITGPYVHVYTHNISKPAMVDHV